MDIQVFLEFVAGGSLLASLLTGALKQALEGISKRYGRLATLLLLFLVSAFISTTIWGFKFLPADIVATAGAIFIGANAIYQLFYKAIWQEAVRGKTE